MRAILGYLGSILVFGEVQVSSYGPLVLTLTRRKYMAVSLNWGLSKGVHSSL